ncbi:MAG: hypothetical protein BGO78_14300 [Chloroflexi bacterium 44-23]|nr:MAG: hypothetical protein BGO78_14300 [Chloroflexi bacterium 44-23]
MASPLTRNHPATWILFHPRPIPFQAGKYTSIHLPERTDYGYPDGQIAPGSIVFASIWFYNPS